MRNIIMVIVCSLILVSSSGFSNPQFKGEGNRIFAQGGRGQGGPPGQQQRREKFQGREDFKALKRMERLRMFKLLDLLDLSEATEEVFIPHIHKHHRKMFQLMKKQQELIDVLAIGLREKQFSDEQILERIIEINGLEENKHKAIKKFLLKSKKILTAEQLGKLYVFQARFGAEVLEKMRDLRRKDGPFRGDGN